MSPAEIAAKDPQRAAYIVAETGQVVTYGELEADANRGAQLFRSLGLQRGDHLAVLLENHPDFFKISLPNLTLVPANLTTKGTNKFVFFVPP